MTAPATSAQLAIGQSGVFAVSSYFWHTCVFFLVFDCWAERLAFLSSLAAAVKIGASIERA